MDKIAPYWKAVIGFVAPAATIVIASVLEPSLGGTDIVAAEWWTAGCTAIITAAGVYAKGNAPLPRQSRNRANPRV